MPKNCNGPHCTMISFHWLRYSVLVETDKIGVWQNGDELGEAQSSMPEKFWKKYVKMSE
jgi:hypothetical protein